ncbi:MAG: hypothetical protein DRI84_08700 [Bacteroidetes bacterium]|nr:MAG: hypothetical protein DRI84_08700 [Bacteroidota bacterium]
MIKKVLFIISFLYVQYTFAQAPKYSNEFLAIGVGARALGMSGSVVASSSSAYSAYWNPAGLVFMKDSRQLSLMHAEYFAGISKYDYGSFAARVDAQSVIAVSMIRFGVDNIPNTSELIDAEGNINYDKVTSFSAADYAFLLSYARESKIEGLSLGGNVKIIRRKVGDFGSSWGFGIDLAAQYHKDKWKFGAVLRDATSTFNAWSFNLDDEMKDVFARTGNEIPKSSLELTMPRLNLGAARSFDLPANFSVLLELDIDITTDGKRNVLIKGDPFSIDPHFGLEIDFHKIVFLRAGIGNIQDETGIDNGKHKTFQPNIGIGIRIKDVLTIDYALTDIGDQSLALYSNVFSIRFSFTPKKSKD